MNVCSLAIPEVKLIIPKVFDDERGSFTETYSQRNFSQIGLDQNFVQDNQSLSLRSGTIRGLHYQIAPHQQGKLVRVVAGAVFDVAVDIRMGSPTYGQHVSARIDAKSGTLIWVPPGFAHGYCTLVPDTIVIYKTTTFHSMQSERGLQWNDSSLAIDWPVAADQAILSSKDRSSAAFQDIEPMFGCT